MVALFGFGAKSCVQLGEFRQAGIRMGPKRMERVQKGRLLRGLLRSCSPPYESAARAV